MVFRNLKSEQIYRRLYSFLTYLSSTEALMKVLSHDFQSFSLSSDETGDSKALSLFFIASPQHSTVSFLSSLLKPCQGNKRSLSMGKNGQMACVCSLWSLAHLTNHSCRSTTQMELLHRLERSRTDSNKFVWGHSLLPIKTQEKL